MADEDRGASSRSEFLYLSDEVRAHDLQKTLKFAVLAELFGVPDLAAEALVQVRNNHPEVVKLLDGLVVFRPADVDGYEALMEAFRTNPRRFAPDGA